MRPAKLVASPSLILARILGSIGPSWNGVGFALFGGTADMDAAGCLLTVAETLAPALAFAPTTLAKLGPPAAPVAVVSFAVLVVDEDVTVREEESIATRGTFLFEILNKSPRASAAESEVRCSVSELI